ncbi:uncharacterized protein [Arachis hypogaea]|uniref:uncharacterized protein n=1 Tax=Arachis hypogaea TaxID=3818 RepID=UPI003B21A082
MPNIQHLKVFGCFAFASTLVAHRQKLDKRSRKCIYLGIQSGTKGFLLMDVHNKQLFASRNVIFDEHIFPYVNSQNTASSSHSSHILPIHPQNTASSNDSTYFHSLDNFITPDITSSIPPPPHTHHDTFHSSQNHDNAITSDIPPPTQSTTGESAILRRSTMERHRLSYLEDYHCMSTSTSLIHDQLSTPQRYLMSNYLSDDSLSQSHKALSITITTNPEPTSYEEAIIHDCWRQAIKSELRALENSNTWKLTSLPQGKKAIGCK